MTNDDIATTTMLHYKAEVHGGRFCEVLATEYFEAIAADDHLPAKRSVAAMVRTHNAEYAMLYRDDQGLAVLVSKVKAF